MTVNAAEGVIVIELVPKTVLALWPSDALSDPIVTVPEKVLLPAIVWAVDRSTKFFVALPVPPFAIGTTPDTLAAVAALVAFATVPVTLAPLIASIFASATQDTHDADRESADDADTVLRE